MPISAIDGCTENHWMDVKNILFDAIDDAGFEANLVSNADDVGVIQKRIVQNLYNNEIVVCDVSARNPNVMFELGMRLAFDKPTIIVKDDRTEYAFDTSVIEHLGYPRDLRYATIIEFKKNLASKIAFTHEKSQTDSNYTTFLKHFGEYHASELQKQDLPATEYIIESLDELRQEVGRLGRKPLPMWSRPYKWPKYFVPSARLGDPEYCAPILEEFKKEYPNMTFNDILDSPEGREKLYNHLIKYDLIGGGTPDSESFIRWAAKLLANTQLTLF